MRISLILAFLFLILCLVENAVGLDDDQQKSGTVNDNNRWRTIVLDFRVYGQIKKAEEDLGIMAKEWLKIGLQGGFLELVDPKEAETLLGHQIRMQDLIDKESRNKIGMILGWQLGIEGVVISYDKFVDVSATLLEIQTGRIMAVKAVTSVGQDLTTIRNLIERLAKDIKILVPPQGEVVNVKDDPDGTKLTLNQGSNVGIQKGTRFEIYYIQKTEKIDEKIKVAEAEAIEVEPDISYAKIIWERTPGRDSIKIGDKFIGKSNLGHLSINTTPDDATVFLDKTPLNNNTPILIDASPDRYNVTITKPGFERWMGYIIVKPYENITLDIPLVPIEFIIVSPLDEVKEGKVYNLVVKNAKDQKVSADNFDWLLPDCMSIITQNGEIKIKISNVKQRSKVIMEGIWKQDKTVKVSKEIVIQPNSHWIGNIKTWVWNHKYYIIGAGCIGGVAYYLLTRNNDGDVVITCIF